MGPSGPHRRVRGRGSLPARAQPPPHFSWDGPHGRPRRLLLGPDARQGLVALVLNSSTSLVAGAILGSLDVDLRAPHRVCWSSCPPPSGCAGNVFGSLGNRVVHVDPRRGAAAAPPPLHRRSGRTSWPPAALTLGHVRRARGRSPSACPIGLGLGHTIGLCRPRRGVDRRRRPRLAPGPRRHAGPARPAPSASGGTSTTSPPRWCRPWATSSRSPPPPPPPPCGSPPGCLGLGLVTTGLGWVPRRRRPRWCWSSALRAQQPLLRRIVRTSLPVLVAAAADQRPGRGGARAAPRDLQRAARPADPRARPPLERGRPRGDPLRPAVEQAPPRPRPARPRCRRASPGATSGSWPGSSVPGVRAERPAAPRWRPTCSARRSPGDRLPRRRVCLMAGAGGDGRGDGHRLLRHDRRRAAPASTPTPTASRWPAPPSTSSASLTLIIAISALRPGLSDRPAAPASTRPPPLSGRRPGTAPVPAQRLAWSAGTSGGRGRCRPRR